MLTRIALFLCIALGSVCAQAPSVAGDWLGTLDAGVMKLRVAFHIQAGTSGLTGTMDSLDQNVKGIPFKAATQTGSDVVFELSIGRFQGKLNAAADAIEGTWSQGGATLPLTLKRVTDSSAFELRRPQNPTKPYPYKDEDVTYANKQANIQLAGTLTIPPGKGPFPATLLITGSGAQDRDESLMGHKPFLVLSDYLTRRGIAVLRVDDRGVGKSTGNFAASTTADFATDVEAGLAFLKTRPEIDPHHIGLVGHSEGGAIAPMVASRNPDVAFIVMMAGPGVKGDEIIVAQTAAIVAAGGASDQQIQVTTDEERKVLNIVESAPDSDVAAEKLKAELAGKVPPAQIEAQIKALTSPWYRYFLSYDPAPALEKVKCPVLAINGEKDLQVPPKQNLPAIRKALEAGGNKNFTLVELPGLNHLLQDANTGLVSEYGEIIETISPVALKTISDWILKQAGSEKAAALK